MTHTAISMRPRPTTYKGIEMRSRLEALFAAQLDSLLFKWAYEPRCFASEEGQYLVDFVVAGKDRGRPDLFIEVKPPSADFASALQGMHIILASEQHAHIMVVTLEDDVWKLAGACYPCPLPSFHTCGCERPLVELPCLGCAP